MPRQHGIGSQRNAVLALCVTGGVRHGPGFHVQIKAQRDARRRTDHGFHKHILQLPDIARPAVPLQPRKLASVRHGQGQPHTLCRFVQNMPDQLRNIAGPLP